MLLMNIQNVTYVHLCAFKKSAQFIHSFLRYSRLENSYDFIGHTYNKVTFSFPESVLACKKSA